MEKEKVLQTLNKEIREIFHNERNIQHIKTWKDP